MDEIMAIAKRHGLRVIEDVSHAQGSLYKGRLTGLLGDVGAMSLMSGKSLVAGEAGMLVTRERGIYERAIAFGHYERHADLTEPELIPYKGYPFGGVKHRLNQLASALGRVQLKHYPRRIEEIQRAMNYFWDLLDGCPGINAHRPPKDSGSTMGGWYAAKGLYRPLEIGGLDIAKFCEAVKAEGSDTNPGGEQSDASTSCVECPGRIRTRAPNAPCPHRAGRTSGAGLAACKRADGLAMPQYPPLQAL